MNQLWYLRTMLTLAVCGVVGITTGCQSTGSKLAAVNPIKAFSEPEIATGVPQRVVGTWSEAVLHQSGKGTRGFGGRLFFYDRSSPKPIRVEGQLVVYAFEEDGRHASNNRPTKRYVFPPEQFAKHESESEVGLSYSVWLPWDEVGGPQAEVSLIARFEPLQGGGLVVSDQTRHRLPGTSNTETMLAEAEETKPITRTSAADADRKATRASYEESVAKPLSRMTATTISLPGRFKNRSAANEPLPAAEVETVATAPTSTTTLATPAQAGSKPLADYQPTPSGTTVQYLTPGESVRRSIQPRSFGSSP